MKRRDFLKIAAITGFMPISVFAARGYQVPVLMYHDINEDKKDHFSVSPKIFDHQMKWLKYKGYNAIPVTELSNAMEGDIVITFDDGFKSFKEYAAPLLLDYKWHATINLVGKWIGQDIPDIKLRPGLNKEEIKQLHATEFVHFGCHTYNLHSLKRNVEHMKEKQILNDLLKFQTVYRDILGEVCHVLAWPFGKYTPASVRAANMAGFEYLLTSHPGKYTGKNNRIKRLEIVKNCDFSGTMNA